MHNKFYIKIKFMFIGLAMITINLFSCSQNNVEEKNMKYNQLSKEEERVIINKGTEIPFTGKYYNYNEKGTYVCKRCNAKLYNSSDKFDSHCGWPSFDDEIKGAVKRIPDKDGLRVEIVCSNCGAHLGHVFEGEGFTDKKVRHCVNSISLNFEPTNYNSEIEKAIFAGGCFWGVEYYMKKAKGVISAKVGYIGGKTDNPTYEDVCTGTTGHVEAVEIVFNKNITNYREIAKLFFEIHDPTQINRQGNDIGYQYRSMIFYTNENQKEIAKELIKELESKGFRISTEVKKADKFWNAENYHQDYYDKNHKTPYCHKYIKRF